MPFSGSLASARAAANKIRPLAPTAERLAREEIYVGPTEEQLAREEIYFGRPETHKPGQCPGTIEHCTETTLCISVCKETEVEVLKLVPDHGAEKHRPGTHKKPVQFESLRPTKEISQAFGQFEEAIHKGQDWETSLLSGYRLCRQLVDSGYYVIFQLPENKTFNAEVIVPRAIKEHEFKALLENMHRDEETNRKLGVAATSDKSKYEDRSMWLNEYYRQVLLSGPDKS